VTEQERSGSSASPLAEVQKVTEGATAVAAMPTEAILDLVAKAVQRLDTDQQKQAAAAMGQLTHR
jgi:hypothetical protein